jgi:hypothetical protein
MVSGPLPPYIPATTPPPPVSQPAPVTTSPPPPQPQAPPPQSPPPVSTQTVALNQSNGTDQVLISQAALNNADRPSPSSQLNITTQSPSAPGSPIRSGGRPNPETAPDQVSTPGAPGRQPVLPMPSPILDFAPGRTIDLLG